MHYQRQDSTAPKNRSKGFTLLELLVTLSITGILMGLATPAMGTLVAKWHRDSATRAIVAHLQLARVTAIKSARRVVMCNSIDGRSCTETSQKDWSGGWLIFQDDNSNKELDATDTVVAVTGPLSGISSMQSSNGVRRFVFMPNGLMAAGMSSLEITPTTGDIMKVIINRTGRFRLTIEPRHSSE